jgi:2-polyprenyl-6-methoxyphenol hydroxylase-like FAD-dependent oxidoreductase
LKHIEVQYGWQVQSFTQDADGVDVVLTSPETGQTRRVRAQFLAGCDGAGSVVRQGLGIDLDMIDLRRLAVKELGPRRVAGMRWRSARPTATCIRPTKYPTSTRWPPAVST